MTKHIVFFFFFLASFSLNGQEIVLLSADREIFQLDLTTCTNQLLTNLGRDFSDISFAPDGRFYGVDLLGNLYEIDITTGNDNLVSTGFGDGVNSLTISASGIAYITGTSGFLWSHDLNFNVSNNLGNLNRMASGDLTFFNGNLYVAVEGDNIVQINLDNVGGSRTVIDEDVPGDIFGVVSFAEDCDQVQTFAITNDPSAIYRINFQARNLTKVCDLDISVFGGASTFEFFGSDPIGITSVQIEDPTSCQSNDGIIEIFAEGGLGALEYSLDNINFQRENILNGLRFGSNTIFVRDENECTISREIIISTFSIEIVSQTSATCQMPNGFLEISTNGEEPITYRINGESVQGDGVFRDLGPGSYTIEVTDGNGCMKDTLIEILQSNCDIFIPNVFSPNGDNINDWFQAFSQNEEPVQIQSFQIFDRWGGQLHVAKDFLSNDLQNWWDGRVNNKSAPAGVYVYLIEVLGEEGVIQRFSGDLTLVR